jgi:hypothetical protein
VTLEDALSRSRLSLAVRRPEDGEEVIANDLGDFHHSRATKSGGQEVRVFGRGDGVMMSRFVHGFRDWEPVTRTHGLT